MAAIRNESGRMTDPAQPLAQSLESSTGAAPRLRRAGLILPECEIEIRRVRPFDRN
jgi:hypothetical protein